jgi:hypothetical protein
MFRPNCRDIFRLIFEKVEYTIDNAFNLRIIVLQELVKIIAVCYINRTRHLFKDQPEDGPIIGPKHVAETAL